MTEAQNEAPNGSELYSSLFKEVSLFRKVLKWEGSFDDLKSFVETTLSLAGTWSLVSGGQKFTTNSKSITIMFHTNTTLQIQGKGGDELKKELLKLATPRNPREPAKNVCSGAVQRVATRLVVNDSSTAINNTACAEGSS
jgi:hypothetical protein